MNIPRAERAGALAMDDRVLSPAGLDNERRAEDDRPWPGWRIYSSGPGIFVSLVASRLIGLRRSYGRTVIDPVVPPELDGMTARTKLVGRDVELVCRISGAGAGPKRVLVNGREMQFEREANPYREGGALIGDEALEAALDRPRNVLEVEA